MKKPSSLDHDWSLVSPTAAPPQLLYLDTLGASPPINGQHGIWLALGNREYVKTVYTPAKHQWLMEELISEWEPE
jgi:hypothetical protein